VSTAIDFLSGIPAQFRQAALGGSLGAIFPKSRSLSYLPALGIAHLGDFYGQEQIGLNLFHFVVFGRTEDQARRALWLMRALRGGKGVQFFAAGRILDRRAVRADAVLSCFLDACAAKDWRAHCLQVVSEREIVERPTQPMDSSLRINVALAIGAEDPPPREPPPPQWEL
jgi:hypothetical protein